MFYSLPDLQTLLPLCGQTSSYNRALSMINKIVYTATYNVAEKFAHSLPCSCWGDTRVNLKIGYYSFQNFWSQDQNFWSQVPSKLLRTLKSFCLYGLYLLACFALLACSVMSDSATPWTVAHLASLFMGLSWEEYWSGVLLQGIFLTQAQNPSLPWLLHWQGGFFTTWATWEAGLGCYKTLSRDLKTVHRGTSPLKLIWGNSSSFWGNLGTNVCSLRHWKNQSSKLWGIQITDVKRSHVLKIGSCSKLCFE